MASSKSPKSGQILAVCTLFHFHRAVSVLGSRAVRRLSVSYELDIRPYTPRLNMANKSCLEGAPEVQITLYQ